MRKGYSFAAMLIASSMAGCGQSGGAPVTDSAAADRVGASAAEQELATSEAADAVDLDHQRQCQRDAQCVPASCCHPTSCVPRHQAPDCTDVLCTLECKPGTLDCGQGYCACQAGSCVAVIESGPLSGT